MCLFDRLKRKLDYNNNLVAIAKTLYNIIMSCRSIHIPPDIDSMVQCEPLVPIPNGHVRYESVDRTTIQPGDMVTYSCDIPYVLEGDTYRVCISNGSWSGEEPTCIGVYQ